MFIRQISVFVENKTGRLAEVMDLLRESEIDIKALTVADTADFGIIRLVADDTEKAMEVLKSNYCTAAATNVIAFSISDEPGELYKTADLLREKGINIKYLYAINKGLSGRAGFIMKASDSNAAFEVIKDSTATVLSYEDIFGQKI